jgi:anti-sigma factor RsiW
VKCSACEARLAAYLEGDLSPADAALVEAHLRGCPACLALADGLRAVEVRLEGLRGIEPRKDFTLTVMAAVAALPVPKPARLRVRWFVAYLAAAWAILIGLTAARVINWQHAFAAMATELGKVGAAGSILADVASRFHIPAFAAAAFGIEAIVLIAGGLVVRHYLPRLTGWIAGAQTI